MRRQCRRGDRRDRGNRRRPVLHRDPDHQDHPGRHDHGRRPGRHDHDRPVQPSTASGSGTDPQPYQPGTDDSRHPDVRHQGAGHPGPGHGPVHPDRLGPGHGHHPDAGDAGRHPSSRRTGCWQRAGDRPASARDAALRQASGRPSSHPASVHPASPRVSERVPEPRASGRPAWQPASALPGSASVRAPLPWVPGEQPASERQASAQRCAPAAQMLRRQASVRQRASGPVRQHGARPASSTAASSLGHPRPSRPSPRRRRSWPRRRPSSSSQQAARSSTMPSSQTRPALSGWRAVPYLLRRAA